MAATFFQGVTLGAYIRGLPVAGRAYSGGAFDWMSPFSLFTGFGLLVTYPLTGGLHRQGGAVDDKTFALSGQANENAIEKQAA